MSNTAFHAKVQVLACSFLLLTPQLNATTLVGIWTKNKVTIAADSKVTIYRGGKIIGSVTACKIFEVRGLVFAFSGLTQENDIDVIEAVRNAPELTSPATGRVRPDEALTVAAENALRRILSSRSPSSSAVVPSVGMIVAGAASGKLVMVHVEAELRYLGECCGPDLVVKRVEHSHEYGGEGAKAAEFSGHQHAIAHFKSTQPVNWRIGTDLQAARHLVGMEANDSADSQFVGQPVSVIEVTTDGARWVDRGACAWQPSS
jgi:hypothetical protein